MARAGQVRGSKDGCVLVKISLDVNIERCIQQPTSCDPPVYCC